LEFGLQNDKRNNLSVKTFSTGEACIKEAYASSPDIVVLDYYLNSSSKNAMNGMRILNILKRINSNIQVIMVSGQDKMEVAVDCLRSGAFDYVIKNEVALVRIKNTINNIIYDIDAKRSNKLYRSLNIAIGIILFVLFAIIITTSEGRF
jgi:two-component system, OmpR family, response regulator